VDLAHRAAQAIENARLYGEAQAAVAARDEFLSIASHELRTPLTALRLALENMRRVSALPELSRAQIERVLSAVEGIYRRALAWVLDRRALTIGLAVVVLFATCGLSTRLKGTFLPSQDMSMVKVALELPSGTALGETSSQLGDLSRQIRAIPGVRDTFVTAGGGTLEEVNKGEIVVDFVPIAERTYGQSQLKDYLRKTLRVSPAAVLSVQDYNPMAGGGNRAQPIQFNLRSTNPEALLAAVEKTKAKIATNPGFVDVDTTWRTGKPQLDVIVDRERAASLGIPAAVLGQNVRALMGGDKVADFHEGGDTYDIKVRLPPAVLADPGAVGAIPVRAPTGQLVELRTVADVRPSFGPSQIDRQAQMRQVTILSELKGTYSLGEAMKFLDDFAKKDLPPSVITDWEGRRASSGR
jgi:HAE1 family hydrophobic/amphiphilic exporter-1